MMIKTTIFKLMGVQLRFGAVLPTYDCLRHLSDES